MKKLILGVSMLFAFTLGVQAQLKTLPFGKGLNFYGADSSFHIRFGFRFQNLYEANWTVGNDDINNIHGFEDEILIRRARLKFDGYAFSPKLTYKMELGLSNRDVSSGNGMEFNGSDNIILDAYVDWHFYKNMVLRIGQAKLPGNIERVISSANLQLVDRSLLNSRFNIDRDMGLQLMNATDLGEGIIFKQIVAVSQGEGRDITIGTSDGRELTFRGELLPFGEFYKGSDNYVGSDLVHYKKPKLMLAATYDINNNSIRKGGNLGSFIKDASGNYIGKDLRTLFVDAAFKYQGFSFMGEYANKKTSDNDPNVFDASNKKIATFTTGEAINLQAGMILNSNHSLMTGNMELVGRYTSVDLQVGTDENQYTIGLNRFISGHQLKVQADLTYRAVAGGNDGLMFRTQMDIHF